LRPDRARRPGEGQGDHDYAVHPHPAPATRIIKGCASISRCSCQPAGHRPTMKRH
jgi:hypothetical protein